MLHFPSFTLFFPKTVCMLRISSENPHLCFVLILTKVHKHFSSKFASYDSVCNEETWLHRKNRIYILWKNGWFFFSTWNDKILRNKAFFNEISFLGWVLALSLYWLQNGSLKPDVSGQIGVRKQENLKSATFYANYCSSTLSVTFGWLYNVILWKIEVTRSKTKFLCAESSSLIGCHIAM